MYSCIKYVKYENNYLLNLVLTIIMNIVLNIGLRSYSMNGATAY